jgi:glycosyltransferase 2 family protein
VRVQRCYVWAVRAVLLAFALTCAIKLRGDLARLTLEPLMRAWDLILLAGLMSLLNYLLRIVRWRIYLNKLGHELSFTFAALTYTAGFAFTLAPAKVGELARARYYRPLGVPVTQVAGAFLVERLMDLLATASLAATLLLGSTWHQAARWGAAGLVCLGLFLLPLLPLNGFGGAANLLQRLPRALHPLARTLLHSLAAARRLLRPRLLLFGLAVGVLAWGAEGLGLGILGSIFPEPQLPPGSAIGIYAAALLAGAFSFMPGGLGGTEAVMTALLAAHGFTLTQALLVTLVCRLLTLWLAIVLGWLAVWSLRHPRLQVPLWQ